MGCLFEFFRQSSVYEAHACLHTYLKLQRRAIQHTPYIIKGLSGVQCIECLNSKCLLILILQEIVSPISFFILSKRKHPFFSLRSRKTS